VEKGKGYFLENVVASCPACKKMRGQLTLDQWFTQMWKVLQHNDVILVLKDQPSSAEMRAKALGLKVVYPDGK